MIKNIILIFGLFLFLNTQIVSQTNDLYSIKFGFGAGVNDGTREFGAGGLLTVGLQKALWNNRLRLSAEFVSGEFVPFAVTDTRDMYYNTSSIGVYGFIDVLKYKSVSLIAGTGGLVNYSRGMLGTGGWPTPLSRHSEYFHKLYYAAYFGAGIRIYSDKSRIAYEIKPVNVVLGNDYFNIVYINFGIDIKLN